MNNSGFPPTCFRIIKCSECGTQLYADMDDKSIECHNCKCSVTLPEVDPALAEKYSQQA